MAEVTAKYRQSTTRNPYTGEWMNRIKRVTESDGLPKETDDYDADDWQELIGKGKRLYNQINYESTNRN